ncbi:YlxR family protein [Leekyejoonella antrihumi]|uniref:YlxR family protein n=1 Tax=Leekyejoonella antrihumi TaxID=1660198 RepID=A0A563DW00_9MICO|nr:YlxR family protein [Leekyejoonella antrihumi]TWP34387.1 YlxR family protein [Leekyejoonella antrihumi]
MNGRTCVGCKVRDDRFMLLRVALLTGDTDDVDSSASVVVPDVRGRLPGRGAWLHQSTGCLQKAIQRRAFGRALRLTSSVDVTRLEAWFTQQLNAQAGSPGCGFDMTESGFDADEHPMSTQR